LLGGVADRVIGVFGHKEPRVPEFTHLFDF